ncbi:MAG: branched-chain amino acid ABC transporter permease [Dehalococcoidia bacterium]|nr:MAG: branched-chain amino acid ABC transporter permease [Dehalococcoidia bacterium]
MVTKLSKKSYFFLGSLVLFSLLPLAIHDDRRLMNLLILSFIWAVVVASWDLIMGYGRVYSFAQIAFFGIGGYTSAMLTKNLGMSPWLGIPIGGAVALGIGLLIGLPCLRLRGMYVGMVTFAVHLILPVLARAGRAIGTGGSWGLLNLAPLYVGEYTFTSFVPWYYVALGMFALFLFIIYKIINSPIGLAFMALRDSEPFAKSLGVDEYRHLLILFGISAFIAGIMGAFYTHYMSVIDPNIFSIEIFLLGFAMLMFGGMAAFPGAVIGAFPIVFINYTLAPLRELRLVILGIIIVAVMIGLPRGIMEIPEAVNRLIRQRALKKNRGERI